MQNAFKTLLLTAAAILLVAGGTLAQSSLPDSGTTPASPMPGAAARAATARGSPVVGLPVKSADNLAVGKIDNVIIGHDGRVQNLVVAVGGVFGVGATDVVVSWNDLTIDAERNEAIAAMSKGELMQQPAFHAPRAEATPQSMIPLPKKPAATGASE
jgi:hypothetical protein